MPPHILGTPKDSLREGEYDYKLFTTVPPDLTYVLLSSEIKSFSIKSSSQGIASADLVLCSNDDILIANFEYGMRFSVIANDHKNKSFLMNVFMIDHVKKHRQKGEKCEISLKARSLTSPLMDYGYHKSYAGAFMGLISEICASREVKVKVDLRTQSAESVVDAWIDADSCYGALRLLGLSFSFCIQDSRDGTLRIVSTDTAQQEFLGKIPVVLDQDETLSFTEESGIRSRD